MSLGQAFTNRRVGINLWLAYASGLPLPLVMGTLDAWMASEKVDLTVIGLFSLIQLPYTLKVLWAPLLDYIRLPFLGRRSSWMVVTQIALLFAIVLLGMGDPVHQPAWLAGVALLTAFLSASQDIVVDGYRAEVLRAEERGPGAAVTVLGGRLALLTAGAGALILSDHLAWRQVYLVMAMLMLIGVAASLLAPVPEGPEKTAKSLRDAIVLPWKSFLTQPAALWFIGLILFYKLGDVVAGKMTTPFLIQMGFTKTAIGAGNKGFGMGATILGAFAGGALLSRWGLWKSLFVFGLLQGLSNLVFIALALSGPSLPLLWGCIGVENLCGGMGTAAFVALLMALCEKEYAGTQYALLSGIMAITRTFAGALTGPMAKGLGWPAYFATSALLAGPGLILLWHLRTRLPERLSSGERA